MLTFRTPVFAHVHNDGVSSSAEGICSDSPVGGSSDAEVAVCLTGSLRYAGQQQTGMEDRLLKALGLPFDIFVYGTTTNTQVQQELANSTIASYIRHARFQSTEQSQASLAELPSVFDLDKDLKVAHAGARTLAERYEIRQCLELVKNAEAARKRSYRFLMRTRTDLNWLANHPPVHLLDELHCWIPEGEDYGGINDRHALCGRSAGEVYFRLWDALVAGSIQKSDRQQQLRDHLYEGNVLVGRFANVAALLCCPSWEIHCHSRPLERLDICQKGQYKYELEYREAQSNAKLLNSYNGTPYVWSRYSDDLDRVLISKH